MLQSTLFASRAISAVAELPVLVRIVRANAFQWCFIQMNDFYGEVQNSGLSEEWMNEWIEQISWPRGEMSCSNRATVTASCKRLTRILFVNTLIAVYTHWYSLLNQKLTKSCQLFSVYLDSFFSYISKYDSINSNSCIRLACIRLISLETSWKTDIQIDDSPTYTAIACIFIFKL